MITGGTPVENHCRESIQYGELNSKLKNRNGKTEFIFSQKCDLLAQTDTGFPRYSEVKEGRGVSYVQEKLQTVDSKSTIYQAL